MKRRRTFVRHLWVFGAALQLATPGLSAVADGMLARASASSPSTHIEATTGASCPVVHSPDCALCRYLSLASSNDAAAPTIAWASTAACGGVEHAAALPRGLTAVLPHGRAPPTV